MASPRATTLATGPVTPAGYPDFERLLGRPAWQRLPERVRRRFAVAKPERTLTYRGRMSIVRHSRLGWLCAQLGRLIGTPVAPYGGCNVQMRVRVYDAPRLQGSVWERRYEFPGHAPLLVLSTKCLDGAGRLVEALGFGLHMRLEVFEDRGDLVFRSAEYYVEVLGLRLTLPRWSPPGQTTVIHRDAGGGEFHFIFFTRHPWFGEMFFQEGVFRDPDEADG